MQINLNNLHEIYSQEPENKTSSSFDLKNVNLSLKSYHDSNIFDAVVG